MATTIRDVASRAGVSIATVSRALRDADSVTAETRARVARAAADLDYVPSQLGRQLAERRHAANGIVFPDLSGPYFAEVVLGYEAAAAELDHAVLILSTHGRDDADGPRHPAGRPQRRARRARPHGLRRPRAAAGPPRHARGAGGQDPACDGADSVNAENTDAAARWPTTSSTPARGPSASSATRPPPPTSPSASSRSRRPPARCGADVTVEVTTGFGEDAGLRVGRRCRHRVRHCPTPSPAPTTSWPSACGSACARPASPCPTTPSSPAGTT